MMNVLQAIEQTPPPASADKIAMPVGGEDTPGAEADELATTLSEIDRLISDVVAEKDVAITPDKGKRIEDASSEDKDFDLWHLGVQDLSKEDKSELKEFAIPCGYQPRSILFGGVDEEILGCIRDRVGGKNQKHFIQECWISEARNGRQLLKRPNPLGLKCDTITSPRRLVNTFIHQMILDLSKRDKPIKVANNFKSWSATRDISSEWG
jgi:hypothetical protein